MSTKPNTERTRSTQDERLKLRDALTAAGVHYYRENYSYSTTPKYNAQQALSAKNQYVTDGTLRYFNAKILDADPILDGLFYFIRQSQPHRMAHTDKVYSYVYFDIWGNVVRQMEEIRENEDEECTSLAQLYKSAHSYFTVNPIEYYGSQLGLRASQMENSAKAYREACNAMLREEVTS